MRITTLFFDLGSTLVYSKDPWPRYYEQADLALAEVLSNSGFAIEPGLFQTESGGFIRSYYDRPSMNNIEPTAFVILRDFLARNNFGCIPETILRAALQAMYSRTQQNWVLEEDAISTLETLKSRDYHMGLISNTSDDSNVQGIVDRWNLRPFFETIVTSAALGIRKPDERIFRVALDRLRASPTAAAMIGDTLNADILGANRSGVYSIWITRRVYLPEEGELAVQPQAVVKALHDLPSLLEEVEKDLNEGVA